MFKAIGRILKTPDLRKKIGFTLGIIALFRLGSFIPAPFVDFESVQICLDLASQTENPGGVVDFTKLINLFSGGALLQLSVFALGIMPYITASIMTQLLRVVIPHFEALHKEGQAGQAKLTQYTRYLTIFLAVLQSTVLVTIARTGNLFPGCGADVIAPDINWYGILLFVTVMTAGTGLVMWMGELITERGIGNGMSLLIFVSIAAVFPSAFLQIASNPSVSFEMFLLIVAMTVAILTAVVFVEQSQRRVPVEYAKRVVGRRTYGGSNTYIPIKVNQAGVIPVIFASSVLYVPALIAQFNTPADPTVVPPDWVSWIFANLVSGDSWVYQLVYFFLTIAFAYFYVSITFNPVEIADNMKKYGGFISGKKVGRETAEYLQYVINRITFPGSIYLATIALIPLIAFAMFQANQNFPFGGASILIIVSVGLDTVKQIDAQLEQRYYEGLLK